MPIVKGSGDLFLSECQTLAHGCNAQGIMGAGIAKEFKKRYPKMFDQYRQDCMRQIFIPRAFLLWVEEGRHWVLNLATQYSTNGASKDLLIRAFDAVAASFARHGIESIAMPLIGAGLGGLDTDFVIDTIDKRLGHLQIPIHVYVEFKPGEKFQPYVEFKPDFSI